MFPCFTDDITLQKPELENIQPFPIEVPSSKFMANLNTPEARLVNTVYACVQLCAISFVHMHAYIYMLEAMQKMLMKCYVFM